MLFKRKHKAVIKAPCPDMYAELMKAHQESKEHVIETANELDRIISEFTERKRVAYK